MNLPASLLAIIIMLAANIVQAAPAWIEQASRPGADSPATGQSIFDELYHRGEGEYIIPYPFTALIADLEARLEFAQDSGVLRVQIPLGRSLQRNHPAPDFFRLPREVIALQGEPVTASDEAGTVLQYRMFIAHQPSSETLEIISYNNAAGRFEFKVVDAYNAEAIPRVRTANRAMCMSCHHNGAAIFSRRPWSETNFNPAVASRLAQVLPQNDASLIDVITPDAGIIDLLAERANYLAAAQAVWRQGCATAQCRAAILRALLQYRLSSQSGFERQHPDYQQAYVAELKTNWQNLWPEGLALASSRLVDRDPFSTEAPQREQDPLIPRDAQANWHEVDSILADGIVLRLAGFLTQTDIRRIDRHLSAHSGRRQSKILYSSCRFESKTGNLALLACGDSKTAESLRARIEIDIGEQRPWQLRILQLKLPADTHIWQPQLTLLQQQAGKLRASLQDPASGLMQRIVSGDRLASLELRWAGDISQGDIRLAIETRPEFKMIDKALQKLLSDNLRGNSDSLSALPFRRRAILEDLMQALDMTALTWPEIAPLPVVAPKPKTRGPDGNLALLNPYCGPCHGDDSVNPPGFLQGPEWRQQIRQCAPRIWQRLSAWRSGSEFPHSPMPPAVSLQLGGSNTEQWPHSDHYRSLLASIEDLMRLEDYALDWQHSAYTDLPPCLALD